MPSGFAALAVQNNADLPAVDSVGVMDEPKIDFRFGSQLERTQRREMRVIASVARHRHVNQINWPRDILAQRVRARPCHLYRRFDRVAMIGVAVTEVR
jgi:hypothetical protein